MKPTIERCSKCIDRIGEPRYLIDGKWKLEGHMLPDDWDKIQPGVEVRTCPNCAREEKKQ